ncbi:L-xylulose reductase [Coccinella septempunctata]|uniref:L-xylulose reductase n=1 Tax=Coccinella septempunctata TaxID=41139 RepID=UPI001D06E2FE|nr:L-xylulose reductase [Coccinella septempunctata]
MEISFQTKRALVTGASKGIGRDLVKQLAKCGAQVIAVARSQELLESLKKEVPSIEIVTMDIGDWNKTQQTLSKLGPIDLLVNNAGLALLAPVTNIPEDHFDQIFNVNVKAVMNVTQCVAKQLIERKAPGSIVNLSSQASMAGLKEHAVYAASKGAIDAYTRVAALELGPHGIRVNSVNPTVIMTDMGKVAWSDPKTSDPLKDKIPLKRFGEVHEVVNTILFLLSDKASLITGVCLPVDGGYTAV